jgi:DNA primase
MKQAIEYLKRVNLAELLSHHYQMQFSRNGNVYASLSPFGEETEPSFFIKPDSDGHWLFKDFSSGHGGSIIDFVMLKENLNSVSDAVKHLHWLLNQNRDSHITEIKTSEMTTVGKVYDVHYIYNQIKDNNIDASRDYLLRRGILASLVDQLINEQILLCNQHNNVSYCTFAVYDKDKDLRCLDNHEIDGAKKFVLGQKHLFSMDWVELQTSSRIYICESIIDYLSIKTLDGVSSTGIALLGNQLKGHDLEFLNNAQTLVSCFDNDGGGFRAYLDLQEKYPAKPIEIYELQANQKDINDRLLSEKQSAVAQNLTAGDKLAIYQAFVRGDNRSQLASDWGIDRSYLYKIVKECEATIVDNFNDKRPGRKSAYDVTNRAEARSMIAQLETEKQQLARDKEYYYAQSEFLKLRLKFSDQEIAELRGDKQASKKTHLKKKKNKKR